MNFCKNCGVELENDMRQCPLCGTSVTSESQKNKLKTEPLTVTTNLRNIALGPKEKHLLQRILWQVTSIILFSGILSTLIIDLAAYKRITWSIYPVTVCMIIFSYASLFAFWHTKKIYQIIVGMLISSVLFIVLDLLFPQIKWPLQLGLPLLFAVNLIAVILMGSIRLAKHRGLNIIAYTCVAIAALCICIEGIVSFYSGNIELRWSVIVAACMLPVTAALLFMHYRIKKNPDMKRIFHT